MHCAANIVHLELVNSCSRSQKRPHKAFHTLLDIILAQINYFNTKKFESKFVKVETNVHICSRLSESV